MVVAKSFKYLFFCFLSFLIFYFFRVLWVSPFDIRLFFIFFG